MIDQKENNELRVLRLTPEAKLPTKANPGDLGYDLYASESVSLNSMNGLLVEIPTGIAIQLPEGWGAKIEDRSSMAKNGFMTCGGVIDAGYRGEIIILARCFFGTIFIGKGQKVAQLVPVRVTDFDICEVDHLMQTIRGGKGFGSSGS